VLLVLATLAELISNDRPLLARYDGTFYFPLIHNPPERQFGGDFGTPTTGRTRSSARSSPKTRQLGAVHAERALGPVAGLTSEGAQPGRAERDDLLGTDGDSHDMVAKLIYGFRVSIWFAFALTLVGTLLGVLAGAVQGYFGGRVDLFLQRIFEIWGACPSCTC